MAIDMPPAMPPELLPANQVPALISGLRDSVIVHGMGDYQLRIVGNRYLSEDQVRQVLAAAQTPSQAIRGLSNAYHRFGHLLVKLYYVAEGNRVSVYVVQTRLADIRAPHSILVHFNDVIGDSDLEVGEFDRRRVLADMKSRRAGVDYDISYQAGDGLWDTVMVFHAQPVPDYEHNDIYLDVGNQGNRFLGRYFGGAGMTHRFGSGTEFSVNYETAIIDWGETNGGKNYDGALLRLNHPSRAGLYGLEASYIEYQREVVVVEPGGGSPLDPLSSEPCLIPDLQFCLPPLDDPLAMPGSVMLVDIDAEVATLALTGEQVLYSTPGRRVTFSQRLEAVTTEISTAADGLVLDEPHSSLELGLKYLRSARMLGIPVRANVQLFAETGLSSDGGTLGTVADPDIVAPGKRTAEYNLLRPKLGLEFQFGDHVKMALDAAAQFSDGDQLPQQQQYVLGGISLLSAYLPGVLVGDSGAYGRLAFSVTGWEVGSVKIIPSLFAEYAQAWYEDAGGVFDDVRSLSDAGLRLKLELVDAVDMELVAATPLSDDNLPDQFLDEAEADFFWRLRLTF